MSSIIRSLLGRVRKFEKKTGAGSPDELFKHLTDDELWAFLEISLTDSEEDQIEEFAKATKWSVKKARGFFAEHNRVIQLHSKEFDHLSDKQLLDMIMAPMEAA
jgi:hypothetical protein